MKRVFEGKLGYGSLVVNWEEWVEGLWGKQVRVTVEEMGTEARAEPATVEGWRTRLLALRAAQRLIDRMIDLSLDGACGQPCGPGASPEQSEKAFDNQLQALKTLVGGVS